MHKQWTKYITMTNIFIMLCMLMFIFMMINYGSTTEPLALILSGAKLNEIIVKNHEWWRLIVASFIHIGFSHIALNMVSIYFAGSELEMIIGSIRFAIIYLLSALGGNLFSFAFNIDTISVGASTAAFGIFAAFIALAYANPEIWTLKNRAQSFAGLIILNIINGFISPGIDNFGHIGGAIFGFFATLLVVRNQRQSNFLLRISSLIILIIMSVILLYLGIQKTLRIL